MIGVFTMHKIRSKIISVITAILLLSTAAAGCAETQAVSGTAATNLISATAAVQVAYSATAAATDTAELFSDRDLAQTADLTAATSIKLVSNQDVTLNQEGVYVISGEAENVTIVVEAAAEAKVQIVLNGVSITNTNAPAIYVKTAAKVFITSTGSQNKLSVTGSYVADGETNLDAVIFSKADLTLNGTGTLTVVSKSGNGITSKDKLKIAGGVYTITSAADALEAHDAILVNGGILTIDAGKDALQCENDVDATLGYIQILNGTLTITAADDAIRGNSYVQIDGGTINIQTCDEGIEATYIEINGGQITLYAKNDGINAAPKVSGTVAIVVNGGTINLTIGSGDTDGFDANGNITINGGTINVQATSAFDADGTAVLNSGTVTVNGVQITQITQTMGGGGAGGGMRR